MDWSIEFKYRRIGYPGYNFWDKTVHKKHGFASITIWKFQLELYWDKEEPLDW